MLRAEQTAFQAEQKAATDTATHHMQSLMLQVGSAQQKVCIHCTGPQGTT